MKKILLLLNIIPILFYAACATDSANTVQTDTKTVTTGTKTNTTTKTGTNAQGFSDEDVIIAQFDSFSITKQIFNVTKTEIELVVEDLNKITFSKDYTRWLTYISDEYRQNFSDPATLEKVSASLPTKGIKLKTLKDYFLYVFVPSRQNMRVDDIQFVSPTRVYVIMEIAPKSPAAIYILEKTVDGWKLVPKNL